LKEREGGGGVDSTKKERVRGKRGLNQEKATPLLAEERKRKEQEKRGESSFSF